MNATPVAPSEPASKITARIDTRTVANARSRPRRDAMSTVPKQYRFVGSRYGDSQRPFR